MQMILLYHMSDLSVSDVIRRNKLILLLVVLVAAGLTFSTLIV